MKTSARLPNELGEMLTAWRKVHWPPHHLRQVSGQNIYEGTHAQLSALSISLGELMLQLEAHINDKCRGRVPRWMSVPKLVFEVERVNLTDAPAQASRRFDDIKALQAACRGFKPEEIERLKQWLAHNPGQELVAHKGFRDQRAFVFTKGSLQPRRLRYCSSGLILAPPVGGKITVQDHRGTVRNTRSDAFTDPLAAQTAGWKVYAAVIRQKRRP